ncbi:RsbRD N-terminal domain-containing protein [Chloroflexota bacterium]
MALEDVLVRKKNSVLKRWFDLIAQTSLDGGTSMLKTRDRFTNPVGHITTSATGVLYEELLQGKPDSQRATASLEDIIRVRAVQDFTPSQAVAFVFLLKKAIRAELEGEKNQKGFSEELSRFESLIDEMICHTFNIYVDCREKIYQIKVDEMKFKVDNMTRLVERMSGTGADE